MYVKINGVFIKLSFWIPVLIIFLGYGFVGRSISMLYQQSNSATTTFLLALCVAGVYILPIGLGGIIATIVSLAVFFAIAGFSSGLVASAAAALVIWLGFQDADSDIVDRDKNLITQQWLIVAATTCLALTLMFTIAQTTTGAIADLIVGATTGSIAVIGLQVKSSEQSLANPSRFVRFGVIASLSIGFIFGLLTYKQYIYSSMPDFQSLIT